MNLTNGVFSMGMLKMLKVPFELVCCSRSVSMKYIKPHPRPYRRRLYEAALAPFVAEKPKIYPSRSEYLKKLKEENESVSDFGFFKSN